MPKDRRLYMTFPIDFDEHPKVEPLSDAAFRTFVAMNGYSRRQRLDGVIPAVNAKKRWKVRALAELVASHPDRPLVSLVDGNYILREYAEHQFTTTDESELHEKRAAAGAKGGKAKASAVASAKQDPKHPLAESESRSELLTDVTKDTESSHVSDALVSVLDSIISAAKHARINNLEAVRTHLVKTVGQPMSLRGALELAQAIASKAKSPVRDMDAYVATTCRNTPAEVQQAFFDLDIAGAE